MERLTDHLQQVATHPNLAQLQQWLAAYMLYAQVAVIPTVEVVPAPAQPSSSKAPVIKQLRWKGTHLRLPQQALEKVPPRFLALLAMRNYVLHEVYTRYLKRSLLLTLFILLVVAPLVFALTEDEAAETRKWVYRLAVVLPLHLIWWWRSTVEEETERELVQRTGEINTLLEALESAVRLDINAGVPDNMVNDMMARLNALRRAHGYPELNRDDLLPAAAPENEQQHRSGATASGNSLSPS